MILASLAHVDQYLSLHAGLAAAIAYLRRTDLSSLPSGRGAVDGQRLAAIVERYATRPLDQAVWESHRRFIDVQYVVSGVERMGWTPLRDRLPVSRAYDADKDAQFFAGSGLWIDVPAGSLAVFFPQDVHAPGLAAGEPPAPRPVVKVVMKVAVAWER